MIRHGETTENARGAISTLPPGPDLTPMGTLQAAAVPQALRDEDIAAIYVSTLTRTAQTARPLADHFGLKPRIIEGIEEIRGGVWEHRNDTEAMRGYVRPLLSWWQDRSVRIQEGEDGHEFFARFDDAIERIAAEHPESTVAIFSHGAALRVWCAGTARNITEDGSGDLRLDNTGMVVMEGTPAEGWQMLSWVTGPVGGPVFADGHPDPAGEGTARD